MQEPQPLQVRSPAECLCSPQLGNSCCAEARHRGQLARHRITAGHLPPHALCTGGQPTEQPLGSHRGLATVSDHGTPECQEARAVRAGAPNFPSTPRAPQHTNCLAVLGAGLALPGSCMVPLVSGAPTEVPRGEQPPAAPAAVAAAAAAT